MTLSNNQESSQRSEFGLSFTGYVRCLIYYPSWITWSTSKDQGSLKLYLKKKKLFIYFGCVGSWLQHAGSSLHKVRLMKVKVTQSCPTLYDHMDYTVHGILQAKILQWVAFLFSRGSSLPRDQTQVSHIGDGFFTSWAPREAKEYCSG